MTQSAMSSNLVFLFFSCCCLFVSTRALYVSSVLENITGVVGDEITFRCLLIGVNNKLIVWFHMESNEVLTRNDLLVIMDSDKQNRYTIDSDEEWFNLTIRNVSFTDEGQYKCGYVGNRGDGGGNVFLTAAFLDVVTIPISPACNVAYPIDIEFPVIGNNVVIECSAPGGDPNPDITWFRDDGALESMASEVDTLNLQLSLQEIDRGVAFRCNVRSPALESVESCQIIPFPRIPIIDITANGLVELGRNITFECDVFGDLPSTILSFGTSLSSKRFILNAAGNILTIFNFLQEDLQETITCEVAYNQFDKPFTSTVDFKSILPDLNDQGNNEIRPNTEETPTLTIILVVLGIIVLILVITALLWYHRKKIMQDKNKDVSSPVVP